METFINKVKAFWSKTNRFHRVLFIFAVIELRLVPGSQYGFWCRDPALSYPFTGDTISWKWLMAVCILLPLVVMLFVERTLTEDKQRAKSRALRWYKEYMFGFVVNLTAVQLLKLIVGSPRPHFFDTCKPLEADTCSESEFISSYSCSKAYWINQSDRSFPSGHTSLAVHAAIFIIYYLHRRVPASRARAAQAACAASAVYCAGSRMTDHRHHWWDVAAGAAIGSVVLAYTILYLCRRFQCSTDKVSNGAVGENTKTEAAKKIKTSTHEGSAEPLVHKAT